LNNEKIAFEFLETQKYFDTFNFAKDLDIDKYSVLCATGGDGTYHEVINGMLARDDKRKIPIALLPNGSGNDLCSSIGIWSLDHALDYICKGECTALDTIRVLLDHESEDSLPEGEERSSLCRHFDINAGVAIVGKIVDGAIPWKGCCGKKSYDIATIVQKCKGNFVYEDYEIEIDGEKVENVEVVRSIFIMFFNGKYTGGGSVGNPFACMNDGLIDMTWTDHPDMASLMGVAGMLDQAKKGQGIQAYDGKSKYMRGRKIKMTFNGRPSDATGKVYGQQLIALDGENLRYDKYFIMEAMPQNYEVMFDSDSYFKEFNSFTPAAEADEEQKQE
jgi:diacylglycerol kinase family enzyme